jgi:hypothetical protein
MTNTNNPFGFAITRRLVAALIITIGMAIVWGVLAGWAATLLEGWLQGNNRVYESIVIGRDGTPLVQAYSYPYADVSYRTLDGKAADLPRNEQLDGAYLSEPIRPPRFFDAGKGWGYSYGASDYSRPRTSWYLISPSDSGGRAYFAGFDDFARMPIGYIGRNGFRRSLPPLEDWFELASVRHSRRTVVASTGYLAYNGPNGYRYDRQRDQMPEWFVYLLDGEQVVEVDLRSRSARRLFEVPGAIAIGVLSQAVASEAKQGTATVSRLAVRAKDRILVTDPQSDWRRGFDLPEVIHDQQVTTYLLDDDKLLLTWTPDRNSRNIVNLIWLEPEGNAVLEESVTLASYSAWAFSERTMATLAVGMVPVPIAWYTIVGMFAPIGLLNSYEEATYSAALTKTLNVCGPAVVVVTVLGLICAWLVWRWQRKYARQSTGWWCAFAFVLGVPGLIAYRLEHRQAKLEACGECGATVPRDRDACAACETPFAAPGLVGTEVFA